MKMKEGRRVNTYTDELIHEHLSEVCGWCDVQCEDAGRALSSKVDCVERAFRCEGGFYSL